MKTQILALLLAISTLTAWAGNEGPQAAPPPTPRIIAQVTRGGGFAPPTVPNYLTIDILSNGLVQTTDHYSDGRITTTELAKLSEQVLLKLQNLVESTQAGELVDPNPSQPGCMDAPSTTYFAVLKNGQKIAIAGSMDCKELVRKNSSESDYSIKNILHGMLALAHR